MSVLIAAANGNWTAASTWAVVDPTSYLNAENNSSAVPASAGASARSSTFVPGAITIDAIAVKIAANFVYSVGSSPDILTLTVNLYNSTDTADVAGTSVTVNVSDIPYTYPTGNTEEGGWMLFKFSAPVTLTAGKSYAVQCVASISPGVSLMTDGTANNWSRMLRTTTTKAPNSGSPDAPDDMVICGEWTAPITFTPRTVTMNNTDATDFGSNTISLITPALAICNKGTLTYGTSASTNYQLRLSGWVIVYSGGTLSIGTSATPIPRTSSAVLELDPGGDGQMGISCRNGGTINLQGLSRTSGKDVPWCLLNANAAAGDTSLTVDRDTGWLSGDQIVVAGTEVAGSAAQNALYTLTANAGATTLTVGNAGSPDTGVTYVYGGVSPIVAEIINLTRNVKVRSTSASFGMRFQVLGGANIDFDWAEIYNLDGSASELSAYDGLFIYYGDANRSTNAPANISIQYCSIHDCRGYGIVEYISAGVAPTSWVFNNNVFWNTGSGGAHGQTWYVVGVGSNQLSFDTAVKYTNNILIFKNGSSGYYGVYGHNLRATITGNRAAGMPGYGFYYPADQTAAANVGLLSDITAHGCGNGMTFTNYAGNAHRWTVSNLTAYRCVNGISLEYVCWDVVNLLSFGNINNLLDNTCTCRYMGFTLAAQAGFPSTTDVYLTYSHSVFLDGSMSVAAGIYTAAATNVTLVTGGQIRAIFQNCIAGAATEVAVSASVGDSFVSFQKRDGVAGSHRTYYGYNGSGASPGIIETDATIYNSTAPSLRITPNHTYLKLSSGGYDQGIQAPVQNGGTVAVSVYIRRSVAGDGAAYNGNLPRLILRSNSAIGVTNDVVLATAAGSPDLAGTWQQLSATTQAATDDGVMEFVVDCDGTAGWINVDDWAVA